MNRFYMDLTVYELSRGYFGHEVIETGKTYSSREEFMQEFWSLLDALKAGEVFQILAQSDTTSHVIENAPGNLFSIFEVWGDGFSSDERGPLRKVTDRTVFKRLLSLDKTAQHYHEKAASLDRQEGAA